MAAEQSLVFYDCPTASGGADRAWSPNTWKTRLSLNYKKLSYETVRIELCDVAALYTSFNAPPTDPSPDAAVHNRFTVPALHDPNTGRFISDSFKTAQYLDETYPSERLLLLRGSAALQYTFDQLTVPEQNIAILGVIGTLSVVPPRTAAYLHKTRPHLSANIDTISPPGSEVRAGQFAALKKALGQIAKAYAYHSASNAVDGKRTQPGKRRRRRSRMHRS